MFKVSNRNNRWKRSAIYYVTRFSILSVVTFEIFGDYIFTKIVFVFYFCIEFFNISIWLEQHISNAYVFRVEKGCIGNEWVNGNIEIKWVNALLMCCSGRFSDVFRVKRKGAFGTNRLISIFLNKNISMKWIRVTNKHMNIIVEWQRFQYVITLNRFL